MESFKITLTQPQFDQLDAGLPDFFNVLFAPGTVNYHQLAFELQREFRQGGSPDVTSMAFDRLNYNAVAGKGNFRVVLNVRFTFGCEDSVTEKKDQTSEWSFGVDKLNKTIKFYSSPFAESRSTADEF